MDRRNVFIPLTAVTNDELDLLRESHWDEICDAETRAALAAGYGDGGTDGQA